LQNQKKIINFEPININRISVIQIKTQNMKGHSNFKLFVEDFKDGNFPMNRVKDFINREDVVPKSIGIEFLESNSKVVISVGHTIENEVDASYELTLVNLGKLDANNLEALELIMNQESSKLNGIICHEFFVSKESEVYSLFLATK